MKQTRRWFLGVVASIAVGISRIRELIAGQPYVHVSKPWRPDPSKVIERISGAFARTGILVGHIENVDGKGTIGYVLWCSHCDAIECGAIPAHVWQSRSNMRPRKRRVLDEMPDHNGVPQPGIIRTEDIEPEVWDGKSAIPDYCAGGIVVSPCDREQEIPAMYSCLCGAFDVKCPHFDAYLGREPPKKDASLKEWMKLTEDDWSLLSEMENHDMDDISEWWPGCYMAAKKIDVPLRFRT